MEQNQSARLTGTAPAFFALGLTAQLGQLAIMRELLVPFQGSEIAIALILGFWLLWTAAGSFIAHRLCQGIREPNPRPAATHAWFSLAALMVCFAMPADILGIRMLRIFHGGVPGEYLPLSTLIAAACAFLAPLGLGFGAQFVLMARTLRNAAGGYANEAAGSAAAGFLLSLCLVPTLNAFQLVFLAGVVHLLATAWILSTAPDRHGRCAMPLGFVGLAVVLEAVLLLFGAPLERASRAAFWRGFLPRASLAATADSAYGHLAVLADRGQYSVYQSGRLVACLPDRGEAAPVAQLFMAQHPKPARVLMIGGGLAGLAKNVLLHPVAHVDYVELDPLLVVIAREFAGADDLRALADRRLAFHAADGRAFLRQSAGGYDLILVSAGDPDTAQANRFYTEEFFREARGKLRPGGVLCLGPLTTVEGYQAGPTLERNACLYWTLRRAFARVLATPGPAFCLLASDAAGAPTLDPATVLRRLAADRVGLTNLAGLLDAFGVRQVNAELRTGQRYNPLYVNGGTPDAPAAANTDQRPRAYYLGMRLWARAVGDHAMSALLDPPERPATLWAVGSLAVALAAALLGLAWRRTGSLRIPAVAVGAFASGLSGMTTGLLVLFAFQNALGSIYRSVGLVLALFMTGAALGSAWMQQPRRGDGAWRRSSGLLLLTAVFLLALPSLLTWAAGGAAAAAQAWGFGALNLLGGILTGACYPLLVKAASQVPGAGRSSGVIYASDLAGGCLGAFVVAAYLAPQFGYQATAFGCAILCGAAATGLWAAQPRPAAGNVI